MKITDMGAAIIAGGESSRMGGKTKALLEYEGETFLKKIAAAVEDMPEIALSVAKREQLSDSPLLRVLDVYPEKGPLSGIFSALAASKKEAVLMLSCDIPFFTREVARRLAESYDEEWDALIPVDRKGQKHLLCGIYNKRMLSDIKSFLKTEEKAGILLFLEKNKKRVRWLKLEDIGLEDDILKNINTPEEYEKFCREG